MSYQQSAKFTKQSILSPEEVSVEGWYTITLNPAEQYIYESTPLGRWNKCYQHIQSLIDLVRKYAVIQGYLELSRAGRCHLHGYIQFKDITSFYLLLPKLLSQSKIEIDTYNDPVIWETYCTKQKLSPEFKKEISQTPELIPVTAKECFEAGLDNPLEYGIPNTKQIVSSTTEFKFFTSIEKPRRKPKNPVA